MIAAANMREPIAVDDRAKKYLSDNRDLYIAQSAATRRGQVAPFTAPTPGRASSPAHGPADGLRPARTP